MAPAGRTEGLYRIELSFFHASRVPVTTYYRHALARVNLIRGDIGGYRGIQGDRGDRGIGDGKIRMHMCTHVLLVSHLIRSDLVSVEVAAALYRVYSAVDFHLIALHHLLYLFSYLAQLHIYACSLYPRVGCLLDSLQ